MPALTTSTNPPSDPGLGRWSISLPTNLIGMLNPFADTAATTTTTTTTKDSAAATPPTSSSNDGPKRSGTLGKRPLLAATIPVHAKPTASPSPTRSTSSVMFAEPDTRSNSDGGSRDGSVDGRSRRPKRSTRPKTQFSICHPPPKGAVRSKLHRRPRSLLQLHRLSANARPRPAIEVIPSINFSVRLTRAVTKVFKAKHGLCPNDLVVMKAEKYNTEEADEEQEARDVIGLICKGRKDDEKNVAGGKASIHMASGRVWDAYPTPTGGYEFVTTDEHGLGLTVRWVPKKGKGSTKRDGSRKFNFSTISPSSRRHPVIANLSSDGFDINDSYKIPEPGAATPLSSPKRDTILEDAMEEESVDLEQCECETDDQLREIITLTAVWVVFKEGWSPNFKYDDKDKDGSSALGAHTRSLSNTFASPPGSPGLMPIEKRSSMKSIGSDLRRHTSLLSKSNRSSKGSIKEVLESQSQAPSRSSSLSRTGRARADSASTVLVHRRNKTSQATWRPDLLGSQDIVQENSREDLSREFLYAPSTQQARTPSPLAGVTMPPGASRKASAAPSSLPDSSDTASGAETTRSRTPVDDKPEHRESATSTSASDASPGLAAVAADGAADPPRRRARPRDKQQQLKKRDSKGKKRGWRSIILCGSGRREE